ncbi:helix-turn-helix domain-containing protein [Pedobacter jeongneungensis]|uniref:helix-turn-helix domain-containing protein n=1 Tax=Pedobacter jeongneungensis TaxID=947309 RepID=UPI0004683CDA|nr:AraC family transcriptional regulator [Pedobacter jeongneungensis]
MAVKRRKEKIEEHELTPNARGGVAIMSINSGNSKEEHDVYAPHRDNHFLLMFATAGSLRINIDFEEKLVTAPAILSISPGQVHHIIEHSDLKGWSVSFDPALMNEELRYLYEQSLPCPLPVDEANLFWQIESLMVLIHQTLLHHDADRLAISTSHHLLSALLNIVAINSSATEQSGKEKRGRIIEQNFGRLLRDHYRNWKQPSQYAAELAISVSHLNDTVKSITGKPVSLHIQQRSILESKRLLYFSDLSIKQIGYKAGYDDPVYFSKLFRKTTGFTPLEFRNKFRD